MYYWFTWLLTLCTVILLSGIIQNLSGFNDYIFTTAKPLSDVVFIFTHWNLELFGKNAFLDILEIQMDSKHESMPFP